MDETVVDRVLAEAQGIAAEFGIVTAERRREACRTALESAHLEVAIWGRFKAGKSSLLNALVGRAVLPTGVVPVTALLTRMRPGPRDSAQVRLLDDRLEAVPISAVADYIAEDRNPKNARAAAEVSIELEGLKAFDGVEFLDTPGTDSTHEHNTRVALDRVPYAQAALVAVSTDQPMSAQDISLIRELAASSARVAVAFTKADRLADKDLADVLAHGRRALAGAGLPTVPLFPFSAAADPRAEGWRAQLIAQWLEPMRKDVGVVRGEVVARKLALVLDDCADGLRLAVAAASAHSASREALIATLPQEKAVLERTRRSVSEAVGRLSGSVRSRIEGRLLAHASETTSGLISSFDARWDSITGGFSTIVRNGEAWVGEALAAELVRVSAAEAQAMTEPAAAVCAELAAICGDYRKALIERLSKALAIRLSPTPFDVEVPVARPDLSIGRTFETPWTLVSWLIPAPLVRPLLRRHFRRVIAREVDKNLRRMVSVWSDGLREAIRQAGVREEACLGAQFDTVAAALATAPDRLPALRGALETVEGLLREVRHA